MISWVRVSAHANYCDTLRSPFSPFSPLTRFYKAIFRAAKATFLHLDMPRRNSRRNPTPTRAKTSDRLCACLFSQHFLSLSNWLCKDSGFTSGVQDGGTSAVCVRCCGVGWGHCRCCWLGCAHRGRCVACCGDNFGERGWMEWKDEGRWSRSALGGLESRWWGEVEVDRLGKMEVC